MTRGDFTSPLCLAAGTSVNGNMHNDPIVAVLIHVAVVIAQLRTVLSEKAPCKTIPPSPILTVAATAEGWATARRAEYLGGRAWWARVQGRRVNTSGA